MNRKINSQTRVEISDATYAIICRYEAKRALELQESEVDDDDPREVLQITLSKSGIPPSAASIIALDVGYCQIIDDDYLAGVGIRDEQAQNIVYREIIRFHLRSISTPQEHTKIPNKR